MTTIGLKMNNGFASTPARQGDYIVTTRPNGDSVPLTFGTPVVYNNDSSVIAWNSASTAADFAGVVIDAVKSSFTFPATSPGSYAPNEAVAVFERGSVNVINADNAAKLGGKVYIRITAAAGKNIGDFEATADGTNNVRLTNAEWGGEADANSVAELVLLTRNRA